MSQRLIVLKDVPLLLRLRGTALFRAIKIKPRQAAGLFALLLMVGALYCFCQFENDLGIQSTKLPTLSEASKGVILFDRNDHYLCSIHTDRDRHPVPLAKMSVNMQKAVVAAEDHNFYNHRGIDPVGILRAAWVNHKAGHIVQGASTITQQLVRNLYLDKNDRTFKRKLREILLSWQIDSHYSKAKILETYLNEIYFGGGVYGIERASQYYFNTSAAKLSVAQAAFLAGVIKSPSVYGTPQHRREAIERGHMIVQKMAEYNLISAEAARDAFSTQLTFQPGPPAIPYPYYVGYVMEILKRDLGKELGQHDFRVYTNLDVGAEKAAVKILNQGIKRAPYGINQGALVTMSLKDGAVLSMVGGVGENKNAWNRAIFPHTAGSSFKPFVYLAALKDGVIQKDTVVNDAPLSINTDAKSKYEPKNFDGQFQGWIPVRSALSLSRNVCAIRVAQEVGMSSVIDVARAAGVRSTMETYPSAALGTCAISPLDMATAYATLARGGVYMPPQMVRSYKSTDGKIKRAYYATASANLPQEAVAQLVDVMQDVVSSGTGTQARLAGVAVAGKTGTADKATDIWFTGFTPDTVTSVWGGNDRVHAVYGSHATGGTVMAHIWHDYMRSFYTNHKAPLGQNFTKPSVALIRQSDYSDRNIDPDSGPDRELLSYSQLRTPVVDLPAQPGADVISNDYLNGRAAGDLRDLNLADLTLADLTPEEQKMLNSGIGPCTSVRRLQAVEARLAQDATTQAGSTAVAQATIRNY